jgi:hypothetical protein
MITGRCPVISVHHSESLASSVLCCPSITSATRRAGANAILVMSASVNMWCPSDTRKPTLSEVSRQLQHGVRPQPEACSCVSRTGTRVQICSLIIYLSTGTCSARGCRALLFGSHPCAARQMLNSSRASAAPRAPIEPVWLDCCSIAPLQKDDKDPSPAELRIAVKPTLKGRLAIVHLSAVVRHRSPETGPPG